MGPRERLQLASWVILLLPVSWEKKSREQILEHPWVKGGRGKKKTQKEQRKTYLLLIIFFTEIKAVFCKYVYNPHSFHAEGHLYDRHDSTFYLYQKKKNRNNKKLKRLLMKKCSVSYREQESIRTIVHRKLASTTISVVLACIMEQFNTTIILLLQGIKDTPCRSG